MIRGIIFPRRQTVALAIKNNVKVVKVIKVVIPSGGGAGGG